MRIENLILNSEYLILENMRENFGWIMTLFGTAVGAGILFLPISAGLAGIIVLLAVMLVSIPTVYFAHRNIGNMIAEAEGK